MAPHVSGASTDQFVAFVIGETLMFAIVLGLYIHTCKLLKLHRILGKGYSFSRLLLNFIYIFGLCFTLGALILTVSTGMSSRSLCDLAIQICLVFYLGDKVLVYCFMCERLRAIRQNKVDRCADILWQRTFFAVIQGFGQIGVVCFFYPVDDLDRGWCAIGLPTFITIPMLIFDIGYSLVMSLIFFLESKKVFKNVASSIFSPRQQRLFAISRKAAASIITRRAFEDVPPAEKCDFMMGEIIQKTFLVSVFILFATIINLVLLFHFDGAEHDWGCFLSCSADVVWGISCITYLIHLPTNHETFDRGQFEEQQREYEEDVRESNRQDMLAPNTPHTKWPEGTVAIARNSQGRFDLNGAFIPRTQSDLADATSEPGVHESASASASETLVPESDVTSFAELPGSEPTTASSSTSQHHRRHKRAFACSSRPQRHETAFASSSTPQLRVPEVAYPSAAATSSSLRHACVEEYELHDM